MLKTTEGETVDDLTKKRAEKLAEEIYPEPSHGPAKHLTRIARDAFVNGQVTYSENSKAEQAIEKIVAGLRAHDEGSEVFGSSSILQVLQEHGFMPELMSIATDADCPFCDYPELASLMNMQNGKLIKQHCRSCGSRVQ